MDALASSYVLNLQHGRKLTHSLYCWCRWQFSFSSICLRFFSFCPFAPSQSTKTQKQKSEKNATLRWWLPDGLQTQCEEQLGSETKLLNWLNTNACVYLPLYKRLQLSPLCAVFLMMHGLQRPQSDLFANVCNFSPFHPGQSRPLADNSEKHNFRPTSTQSWNVL